MMPNEEILKKIIGDPTDEAPEAAYRLAATAFVGSGRPIVMAALGRDKRIKTFLDDYPQFSEFVASFVLAGIVEILPMPSLDDERKRLAYNLRVRTYEEFGEGIWKLAGEPLLNSIPELAKKAVIAIRLAKGQWQELGDDGQGGMLDQNNLKSDVPATPESREGQSDRQNNAAAGTTGATGNEGRKRRSE